MRKILNFGHTLGHAIETYCLKNPQKITLLHGEAIAIGMITETYLSTQLCGLEMAVAKEIKEVFLKIFPKSSFSQRLSRHHQLFKIRQKEQSRESKNRLDSRIGSACHRHRGYHRKY